MWVNSLSLKILGRRLAKSEYRIVYFDYPNVRQDFEANVDSLYRFWQQFSSAHTHLVAHSLGGLLVLRMMQKYQLTQLPRSLIFGCPVNGSAVAGKVSRLFMLNRMLGASDQVLINGFEGGCVNRVGVISGTLGVGIGHLFQRIPKPHDGVISVVETEFPSAEVSVDLSVSHATMLISAEVAINIVSYLHQGRFECSAVT